MIIEYDSKPNDLEKEVLLFNELWNQRGNLGAEPILLPDITSSYGLPILIGLREIHNPLNLAPDGFLLALFEDRRSIREETTLGNIIIDSREQTKLTSRIKNRKPEEVLNLPVAGLEPLGWITLERLDRLQRLSCATSELIGQGAGIALTSLANDPYFLSLSKKSTMNALVVGFEETFQSRRDLVQRRLLGILGEQHFVDYSDWKNITALDKPRQKKLRERLHTRRKLGTLLLEQSIRIAQQTHQKTIEFLGCTRDSTVLLQHFTQSHHLNLRPLGYHDFEISI